jgi:hypothetical protein
MKRGYGCAGREKLRKDAMGAIISKWIEGAIGVNGNENVASGIGNQRSRKRGIELELDSIGMGARHSSNSTALMPEVRCLAHLQALKQS